MHGRRRLRVTMAVVTLIVAACGSDDAADTTTSSTAVVTTTTVASTTTEVDTITVAPPDPNVDPEVRDVVNLAVGDLVERLGISSEDVTVISGSATTWPDASFGCPEPGVQYVQALVDGAIVVLEAGGVQYEYHSGGTALPELCENPSG